MTTSSGVSPLARFMPVLQVVAGAVDSPTNSTPSSEPSSPLSSPIIRRYQIEYCRTSECRCESSHCQAVIAWGQLRIGIQWHESDDNKDNHNDDSDNNKGDPPLWFHVTCVLDRDARSPSGWVYSTMNFHGQLQDDDALHDIQPLIGHGWESLKEIDREWLKEAISLQRVAEYPLTPQCHYGYAATHVHAHLPTICSLAFWCFVHPLQG
jgi:hypothetical protein